MIFLCLFQPWHWKWNHRLEKFPAMRYQTLHERKRVVRFLTNFCKHKEFYLQKCFFLLLKVFLKFDDDYRGSVTIWFFFLLIYKEMRFTDSNFEWWKRKIINKSTVWYILFKEIYNGNIAGMTYFHRSFSVFSYNTNAYKTYIHTSIAKMNADVYWIMSIIT